MVMGLVCSGPKTDCTAMQITDLSPHQRECPTSETRNLLIKRRRGKIWSWAPKEGDTKMYWLTDHRPENKLNRRPVRGFTTEVGGWQLKGSPRMKIKCVLE
jgi:hypothetical protein